MKDDDARKPETTSGVSRRDFMKISAVTAAVPLVLGPKVVEAAGEEVAVHGPGKVPVTLNVNGKKLSAELEPRVTLLDALRGPSTSPAPSGCATAAPAARAPYCSTASRCMPVRCWRSTHRARRSPPSKRWPKVTQLSPVMQAFVEHDAQQCGFCTPGFVVATTYFLQKHPKPSADDIRREPERQLLPLRDL